MPCGVRVCPVWPPPRHCPSAVWDSGQRQAPLGSVSLPGLLKCRLRCQGCMRQVTQQTAQHPREHGACVASRPWPSFVCGQCGPSRLFL